MRRAAMLLLGVLPLGAGCQAFEWNPELTLADLRSPGPAVYFLGEEFEGAALTSIVGTREHPTLVYGGCESADLPDRVTCVPPVQLEQQPLEDRSPARYADAAACTAVELRGVPGAWLDDDVLDLFTGDRTITVYATSPALALRAVEAIRPVSGGPDTLPPPARDLATELARC